MARKPKAGAAPRPFGSGLSRRRSPPQATSRPSRSPVRGAKGKARDLDINTWLSAFIPLMQVVWVWAHTLIPQSSRYHLGRATSALPLAGFKRPKSRNISQINRNKPADLCTIADFTLFGLTTFYTPEKLLKIPKSYCFYGLYLSIFTI